MLVQTKPRTYTPEEYLALDSKSDPKHEYHNEKIVPITGCTANHNRIALNLVAFLKLALRGQKNSFFSSDVRLWIPAHRRYTYPDLQIICGDIAYHDNRKDTVTNPAVIVEVLSNTRNYDRGDKFQFLRSLPTFQEYITIDQYRFDVEHYIKNDDDNWLIRYLESEESVLSLVSVEFEISLKYLYEDVRFEEEEREVED